jgi:multidrug resistance efflux pump
MKRKHLLLISILLSVIFLMTGCDTISPDFSGNNGNDSIQASGVIEAEQVSIASELSGRIDEVFVQEGENVNAGDPVFTLETDLLSSQKVQVQAQFDSAVAQMEGADASVTAANAAFHAAEINLRSANIQYKQVSGEARLIDEPDRVSNWNESAANNVDVPAWYFQQSEMISAAESEVDAALELYQTEQDNYQDVIVDIGSDEFIEAEKRLVEAQTAFEVADILNDRRVGYEGREEIEDFVETIYDSAESELKAAQKAYDQLLSEPDYQDILEARARVTVAKERYDIALDQKYLLLTGEHSLDVQAAETVVAQAKAGIIQAKSQVTLAEVNHRIAVTTVAQAEAALDLINLQLDKLMVYSPISGVVLTRTIEPGEVIQAGLTTLVVGELDQLTVTVYLSEDRYGQVNLGDAAELSIDSFPGILFNAEVKQISNQAEYTPRNVQTQEERQNTVYAVKLSVPNPDGKLKPGMPADVVFLP